MQVDELGLPDKFEWWNVRASIEEWVFKLVNAFVFVPSGAIMLFGGTTAPDGWVECDNASYEKTKYPDLYTVIGNTYGSTATTFQVPPTAAVPVGQIWIIKT